MVNTSLYKNIVSALSKTGKLKIGGLWGSSSFYLVAQLYLHSFSNILLITPDIESVEFAFDDLKTFLAILSLPAHSGILACPPTVAFLGRRGQAGKSSSSHSTSLFISPEEERDSTNKLTNKSIQDKLLFLTDIRNRENKIITCSQSALFSSFPHPKDLDTAILSLKTGQSINREKLLENLIENGYERTNNIVSNIGEIGIRGGIMDIFPYGVRNPVRIEWNGNRIESIRFFDIESQVSVTTVNDISFYVPKDLFPSTKEEKISLLNYFTHNATIVFVESETGIDADLPAHSGILGQAGQLSHNEDIIKYQRIYLNKFPIDASPVRSVVTNDTSKNNVPENTSNGVKMHPCPATAGEGINITIESLQRFGSGFSNILREMENLCAKAKKVYIFSQNQSELSHLNELLSSNSFAYLNKLKFSPGQLHEGFYYRDIKTAFISHNELFNRYRLLRKPKRLPATSAKTTEPFWELQRGDFAVHTSYGIGRYIGLKRLYNSEFLVLEYLPASPSGGTADSPVPGRLWQSGLPANQMLLGQAGLPAEASAQAGQDKSYVYVPVTQVNLVSKYWGADRRAIKIDKLGGSLWLNRKERVKNAVKKLAQELLYIQALRLKHLGFTYPHDTEWQREFESSFPYEETPDQTSITQIIKDDMENPKPMDRLICGDVGYGKTELAIRAAFKATLAGKQVALVAPTTILSQQHYQTFSERMAGYPVNIEVISRFKTEREQNDVIERVASGKIDIIIGTHRLLQDDIKFKDLGLVIIDEEQRFGVEHKEFFKKIKANIDVLTLSATPIPRTLHLTLSGLREISTMVTPPQDRRAIQTTICRFDEQIIKEVILRELNRKGQVYFVHNRIFDIEKIADKIKRLLPGLSDRTIIAHGQMPGFQLEQRMQDFIDGKYDILICTNIIESGLDIPRVNTIFINNADDFGLSDLHQLRGRVGRYKHQAYAYFLIPPDAVISSDAAKRLKAIEEFNELGAGFKIAMRDMEIRGIGNILGKEQHGHIAAVGYEFYCKLLEKSVKQIKRHKKTASQAGTQTGILDELSDDPASLKVNNVEEIETAPLEIDPNIEAYIPADYVTSERERLNIYRRLSIADDESIITDLENELKDRFGKSIPQPAKNLLETVRILDTK